MQTGATFVVRGGSYLCCPSYCARFRPSSDRGERPDMTPSNLGFRVAPPSQSSCNLSNMKNSNAHCWTDNNPCQNLRQPNNGRLHLHREVNIDAWETKSFGRSLGNCRQSLARMIPFIPISVAHPIWHWLTWQPSFARTFSYLPRPMHSGVVFVYPI